jgi:hypothetical protein
MDKDQLDKSQKIDNINKLYRQVNNLRNSITKAMYTNGDNKEFDRLYDKMMQEINRLEFYLRKFK